MKKDDQSVFYQNPLAFLNYSIESYKYFFSFDEYVYVIQFDVSTLKL